MAEISARFGLPYIVAAQSQKHVTHNEALRQLDGIVQASVVDRTTTAPPASPAEGACYLVADGATGGWTGWDGDLALWADGFWYRIEPPQGMRAWNLDAGELIVRVGSDWVSLGGGIRMVLTAPTVIVTADADGSNPVLTSAATEIQVFAGEADDTANWSFSRTNGPGVSSTLTGTELQVTALSNDTGYVDVTATRTGYSTLVQRFTIAKAKAGQDAITVAQITAYKRSATTPSTPSGGSYNFATKTLTPPSGWSATIPEGEDPLYTSFTSASTTGDSGEDNTLTWTSPSLAMQNGTNGNDGSPGDDGTDGQSTYQAVIYKRNPIQPSTPFGGSFNFGTNALTTPSGWSEDIPAGTDPVWASRFLFYISGDTGSDAASIWSTPVKFSENGADGSDGISTYTVPIYRRAATPPSTPSGGSYNFGTNTLTPPSGWSEEVPDGTDLLYISTTRAVSASPTGSDSSLTWKTPTVFARDGADGADGSDGTDGNDGDRGPGRWHVSAGGTLPTTSSAANTLFVNAAHTPATPVRDDQAWFYLGTMSNQTAQVVWIFNGTLWEEQAEVIDGNLLVTGTLTANKIITDEVTLRGDEDGSLIVPENGVDAINVAPGTLEINAATSILASKSSAAAVTAGGFTVGETYVIYSLGTTNWQSIGAKSGAVVGSEFVATGAGSGTGQAVKGYQNTLARLDFAVVFDTVVTVNWSFSQSYPSGTGAQWGYQVRQTNKMPTSSTVTDRVIDGGWLAGTSERKVFDAYWQVLLRLPDQTGFDYYVDQVENYGMSEANLRATFKAGSEYSGGIEQKRAFMSAPNDTPAGFVALAFYGGGFPSGDIVDGREYIIAQINSPSDDFTTIGADRNEVGVRFTATDDGFSSASRVLELQAPSSMVENEMYMIYRSGDTDFTAVGADHNHRGHIFRATGAGAGTGKVLRAAEQSVVLEWFGMSVGGSSVSAIPSIAARGARRA